jgi:PemK-like, MazF-like toxin of type II toxin-antitoxin system
LKPVGMIWHTPPLPGDIVQCWFPQDLFPEPGPKSRPALVIHVDEFEVRGERQADVTIAYGTSVINKVHPGEFVLTANHKGTGLRLDTKFNLAQQCTLPFNDIWFEAPPVLGKLPLHLPAVKSAFAAAWAAATKPQDRTAPRPNLRTKR